MNESVLVVCKPSVLTSPPSLPFRVLTPHKRQPHRKLNTHQKKENKAISRRRMPCEHIMSFVKNHNILRNTFRGDPVFLERCYKVAVHMTALMLRMAGPGEAGYCLRVGGLAVL